MDICLWSIIFLSGLTKRFIYYYNQCNINKSYNITLNEGNQMIHIHISYKIVPKKETKVLLKTIKEIKTIEEAYNLMYFFDEDEEEIKKEKTVDEIMTEQIMRKCDKCFRFYQRNYDVKISDENFGGELISEFGFEGLRVKNIENNLAEICETIRSWE